MKSTWMNYFDSRAIEDGFGYKPEASKLGTVLAVLFGRKRMTELNNCEFVYLGYKQEIRQYDDEDVTAETVLRLSNEREVKLRAEQMLGTLIYNLRARCETLNERVAELEALTKKETTNG